ncbi:hypothetical protein T492DRAFT_1061296 [Pavlovales sp. CCMP2436]|nr:hypothetical protein T492DRAFT_1061296 [Pavlovales sp. CCMP2436]
MLESYTHISISILVKAQELQIFELSCARRVLEHLRLCLALGGLCVERHGLVRIRVGRRRLFLSRRQVSLGFLPELVVCKLLLRLLERAWSVLLLARWWPRALLAQHGVHFLDDLRLLLLVVVALVLLDVNGGRLGLVAHKLGYKLWRVLDEGQATAAALAAAPTTAAPPAAAPAPVVAAVAAALASAAAAAAATAATAATTVAVATIPAISVRHL